MIFSGIGDVVGGLINGSVTNVEQAVKCLLCPQSSPAWGMVLQKGYNTGQQKLNTKKNIGASKSNIKINKKLEQADLKGVKIGRDGLSTALEAIKKQYYRYLYDGINALYGFIYGSFSNFYGF